MRTLLIVFAIVAAALSGAAVATVLQDQDEEQRRQAGGSPSRSAAASAVSSPEPTPEPSPVYQAPEDLNVGDCFNSIEDVDDGDILAGRVLPCDVPHGDEVVGISEHPAGPGTLYPGEETLRDWAESRCGDLFALYVGIAFDDSRLEATTITPAREIWEGGDRRVICTVVAPPQGFLTGSVKGTGR